MHNNGFQFVEPPLNPVAEVLSQCCVSGEDLALKGDACANIKPPLDIVPEDLISSCFFSSEICCASKVRIEQCKHGVLAAKDGLDCHENGTDYFTGCCESCKIGLVVSIVYLIYYPQDIVNINLSVLFHLVVSCFLFSHVAIVLTII